MILAVVKQGLRCSPYFFGCKYDVQRKSFFFVTEAALGVIEPCTVCSEYFFFVNATHRGAVGGGARSARTARGILCAVVWLCITKTDENRKRSRL